MIMNNWSSDFKVLLGSLNISLYSTSLLAEVIDAYGVTKKAFNSSFRTRYSDINDIKNNVDYYAKKAPFLVVDERLQAISSFVHNVDDIVDKKSATLICMNTALAIALPANFTPIKLEDYLVIAAALKNGDKKEQAIYAANEKYFNRIALLLHHLKDVDLKSIAEDNAVFLTSHIKVTSFVV